MFVNNASGCFPGAAHRVHDTIVYPARGARNNIVYPATWIHYNLVYPREIPSGVHDNIVYSTPRQET